MLIIFSVIFLRSMPEEFSLGIFLSNISADFWANIHQEKYSNIHY